VIRRLPLVGELPNSKKTSIVSAMKETGFSTAFSTVPIWFFPIFSALFLTTNVGLVESVYQSVSNGDLYLYACSLVGPLIFAITSNYASWEQERQSPGASRIGHLTFSFPYGTWFFIISIIICVLAGMCFGLVLFSTNGAISARLNTSNLCSFSVVIYGVSTLCLFCVSVYRNEHASGKFADADSTRDFLDQWNSRNG